MMFNKTYELTTESIPGCILQCYVYLVDPEDAGMFALLSIFISALTTGYSSAMIAFDSDVDVAHRKSQPKFYGYVPDDNDLRGRTFGLMTMMGALHNLSRSVGYALLIASSGFSMALSFFVGELVVYLLYKIARRDFIYWIPLSGKVGVFGMSIIARLNIKVSETFRNKQR